MIGDHLQSMPVGHSGAMATMQRRSGHVVELTAVHRFRDPSYAALTLRLRDPVDHAEATEVAHELAAHGRIELVDSEHHARERMVDAWLHHAAHGELVALVTATNAEAQQINDRIQQERLDRGQLTADRFALGQHGQYLLAGDVVQTRRNDTENDVDNRATWTVTGICHDRIELASITDSGDRRAITHDYAAEHVHLAYASTVHGVQGETVHASYVGPGVDAAGLYVGMTRGRHLNTVLAVAPDPDTATQRLADTMMRGQLEITFDDALRAAQRELGRAPRTASATATGGQKEITSRIAAAEEQRRAIQEAMRHLDARAATSEASGHGRLDSEVLKRTRSEASVRRAELATGMNAERARIEDLVHQYWLGSRQRADQTQANTDHLAATSGIAEEPRGGIGF